MKLLVSLAFLYLFPLSTGWTNNSLVCTAQPLASSTQLTECWVCLPWPMSVIDNSNSFYPSIKNFSQVLRENGLLTKMQDSAPSGTNSKLFSFLQKNSNVIFLTLLWAAEREYKIKTGEQTWHWAIPTFYDPPTKLLHLPFLLKL